MPWCRPPWRWRRRSARRRSPEFVEDEDTEYCLRRLGVQRVQGYLYGAPRPLAEVLADTAAEATATGG